MFSFFLAFFNVTGEEENEDYIFLFLFFINGKKKKLQTCNLKLRTENVNRDWIQKCQRVITSNRSRYSAIFAKAQIPPLELTDIASFKKKQEKRVKKKDFKTLVDQWFSVYSQQSQFAIKTYAIAKDPELSGD